MQAEDRELALMAPPKPMTTTKTFQAPPKPKPQPKKKPQVNSRAKAKQQALGWNTKQAKAMAPGESELQGTKQKGCSWQVGGFVGVGAAGRHGSARSTPGGPRNTHHPFLDAPYRYRRT